MSKTSMPFEEIEFCRGKERQPSVCWGYPSRFSDTVMAPEALDYARDADRLVRSVLSIDLVESVRLIEEDEDDAVARWRGVVAAVETLVLPRLGGRLVKSLGDGLMLEFAHALPAINAAHEIHRVVDDANVGVLPQRRMLVRIGCHAGTITADRHDVYGRDVNLAARLSTLAGPGETVASAEVRDQLTPSLDADVEDLGECYLKHVKLPVRAYRIGAPGPRPVVEPGSSSLPELRPAVAVIPFTALDVEARHDVLGQILADEIIGGFSRSPDILVVSRLSTTAFRGRNAPLSEVNAYLHANYVLSGTYRVAGDRLTLAVELANAKAGVVVWSASSRGSIEAIVRGEDDLVAGVVTAASAAMISQELRHAQTQPLPTLESYTLLLGAISLMHRLSSQSFDRSRQMLDTLIERAPRLATPHAWLAKWHVLRVQQGWSSDPDADARLALDCTKRALDNDATCSLAMAIDGFVHTNLLKRLDVAMARYELAISVNPNDSLAWLLMGTLHAFQGDGKTAVRNTRHALKLSPLDPIRYFYESLAATAALSAGQYGRALELAKHSLRLNRTHTSTLRVLAVAQWKLERFEESRTTVKELLRLEPHFTVSRFLSNSPSGPYQLGQTAAVAFEQAGVPK